MSDIDDDAQQEFEDLMLDRDKAISEEHDTTTEALRQGSGLDERLKEERGAGSTDPERLVPTELDQVDDEPDMVADPSMLGDENGPFVPGEEAAMHVVEDAPGATDHPDDMAD